VPARSCRACQVPEREALHVQPDPDAHSLVGLCTVHAPHGLRMRHVGGGLDAFRLDLVQNGVCGACRVALMQWVQQKSALQALPSVLCMLKG